MIRTHIRRISLGPPRKAYKPVLTPWQLAWHNAVSINVKYFGLISAAAWTFTHVHPNTLVTLGPPAALAAYYGYAQHHKRVYTRETSKIPEGCGRIRVQPYDETLLANVVQGLENQFDHFKHQVVELMERRVVNYISAQRTTPRDVSRLFIDANDQFSVNVDENGIETFVVLQVAVPEGPGAAESGTGVDFIKLSLPFYSKKDVTARKRLGTIQIYLLEVPTPDNSPYLEYKMALEISPYQWLVRESDKLFISSIEGEPLMESRMLKDSDTDTETVDI